jgi:pimeloyl-ACP methyl ester carboxylesterase
VPVLVIGGGKDPIGLPSFAEQSTKPYAKDYQFAEVEAGHFVMLEQADKVNEILRGFLEKLSK